MKQTSLLIGIIFILLISSGCEKNKEVTPDNNLQDHSNEQPEMKGYDLYTWSTMPNEFHYAILPGTNRFKNKEELTLAQDDIINIKKAIRFMPNKTYITWNHKLFCKEMPGMSFVLPDKSLIKELQDICKSKGTELWVDE